LEHMDKNTMIGLGVVALLIIGGVIWASAPRDGDDNENDEEELATTTEDEESEDDAVTPSLNTETRTETRATTPTSPAPTEEPEPGLPATATVRYTEGGFDPSTVRIAQGGTVTFINEADGAMWVASDNHPSHSLYSAFDQKTSVGLGGTYVFPFLQSGTWGFHNHMNPSHTGMVVVGN
jgi:plastocyanin